MLIKDLLDLPEQVNRGDFVLRLAEGVSHPEQTVASYVVTPQLERCFDEALSLIRSAVEGGTSKAAYLHGSFGSGKSHFMAVLHLILQGNARARGIDELAAVVSKHNGWMEGKRFLLVPFHLIGSKSMESAVLGGYVRHLAVLHPEARTPAVYRSEQLLRDADGLRENLGDAKFFDSLNGAVKAGSAGEGWGEVSSNWNATAYGRARNAAADSPERQQLVGDLIDTFFKSMKQTDEFVSLDDGLAVLSAHAKSLGYDALILFLDELILWLASHAADINFVSSEAQKVPKLVESERGDRPVPIVSFVARQRDLRELVGQHITGAEKLSFSDVLSYWEGRFGLIKLEDRNLPVITEKRILRVKNPEARRLMDEEFKRTASTREEVMRVLLTSTGNRDDFRKLYPFSPALVETLVAVSSLLQRERTALKIMVQLLVKQRDTLRLGQLVPVGDLYDEIAQGGEAFSSDMKAHFDNARKLYYQHLRPAIEDGHGLTFDDAERPGADETKRRGLMNDDRLVKTLLLAALAPAVESLKNMTPARLAALNHGTIKSPIAGQEATTVLNKCKTWAASVGQIKIQEGAGGAQPTIQLQISGVDVQSIIDQAEAVDNQGNRIRKLKEMLFTEFGIPTQQELFSRHSFRWRGTDRECDVLVSNVREVSNDTLATGSETWRLIIDYPFDHGGHSVRDDLARLETFRQAGRPARTICWLPTFLNHKAMEQLGRLVRLDHILTENRFPTFVSHLAEVDRAAARAMLDNQRDVLRSQFKAQAEMAYGLRGGGHDFLDAGNQLDPAEHFQSLDPAVTVQPPAASNFGEALQLLLDQALRGQFPAHPTLSDDTSLTKSSVQKVFEVIQQGLRSTEPSVLVGDLTTRKHLLRIAVPLRLGEAGENRFQVGVHWRQHFERQINLQRAHEPVTVKALRGWIDEPKPMGLPMLLQDLVIMTFAEQTNRSFVLHTLAINPELGSLDGEAVLRETPLPDEPVWEVARTRAKSIFGFDTSPLRNATNVAQMASKIRELNTQYRPAVRALPKLLADSCSALGLATDGKDRIVTATAADALLKQLGEAKEDRDLVTRLGQASFTATEAALGASIMQSMAVSGALQREEWRPVFLAIRDLMDDRQPAAQRVWQQLEEGLESNEHAVALVVRLQTLHKEAISLLTKPVRPAPPVPGGGGTVTPSPPDQSAATPLNSATAWAGSDLAEVQTFYGGDLRKIERNRQLVGELKALYGRSQVEADDLPNWVTADVLGSLLEVHVIQALSKSGADERSNMIVLTPTLHALVHLDPGALIDLKKGILELPKFGLRAKVITKPNHNG